MESLSRSLIGKIDLPSSINTFVISHLWINEKLSSLSLLWTSVSPCVKTPLVPHGDDSEGRASMVNVWRLHSSLGPISWFPIFLCISAYAKVPQISLLKGHMQVNEDFFFLMHFSALSGFGNKEKLNEVPRRTCTCPLVDVPRQREWSSTSLSRSHGISRY